MPKFQVLNTATNEARDYDVSVLRPAGVLPVPYVSQIGAGADKYTGDCGGACSTMLLRGYNLAPDMTPDRFMAEVGKPSYEFLNFNDIMGKLKKYGLSTEYRPNMQAADLFSYMVQQKPMIMLVNYGVLVNAGVTEKKDFKGPHFFLAVGMDNKYVYVHDPYCVGNGGEARQYPYSVIMEAWTRGAEQGNPNNAGVIPTIGLNQAPPPNNASIGTSTEGRTANTNTTPIYKARVVHQRWVNIRNGPGTNFLDIGDVLPGEVKDVFEERPEAGGNAWARIGPGQWIYISSETAVKA
jgi:hypothetical protein